MLLTLFLYSDHSTIYIDGKLYSFDLPVAIKLIALQERERYFNVWIDEIIAPGVQAPEEKVNKIFEWIASFKERPEDFRSIEQHEYYILINQYGSTNHLVRVFCLLVTVAGYQAIPFKSEADGRVIVRIPGADEKWLRYDLKNKTSGKEVRDIELSDEVKRDIRAIDTVIKKFWQRRYTRGDKNVLVNRIFFEILKKLKRLGLSPEYIAALKNNEMLLE
jgi:hypothetical protein